MVRGLNDLKDELRSSLALLREEMRTGDTQLTEEIRAVEGRTAERIECVYDAVTISDLTRRNAELEEQVRPLRAAQETQQHEARISKWQYRFHRPGPWPPTS